MRMSYYQYNYRFECFYGRSMRDLQLGGIAYVIRFGIRVVMNGSKTPRGVAFCMSGSFLDGQT